MIQRKSPRAAPACSIESLESRSLLSANPVVATVKAKAPVTTTTVQASKHAAFLGQSITLTVTVKSNQAHTTPSGSIELLDNGNPIEGLDGPLIVSLNAKGKATYVFGPGNVALFVGANQLNAEYLGNGAALPASKGRAAGVSELGLHFKDFSDGLAVSTVKNGSGKKTVAAGDFVQLIYTGFLASNGTVFDYSSGHGAGEPTNLTFQVEADPEQVIVGFDQGVVGMKVGETRVLLIPAAIAYGDIPQQNIPANSDLLFYVTLQAIL